MATMFRDFSFDISSRHPSSLEADRVAMDISPTSTPFVPLQIPSRLPTPPPCSVGELAQRLDQHSLRVDVHSSYQCPPPSEPLTPPSDNLEFPIPLFDQEPRPYSRISTAALRMQRQANTRMQCSSSHVRDISILVQKMIQEEEQCNVCDTKSQSSSCSDSSTAEEDEGVDMNFSPPSSPQSPPAFALKFRRSTDRLNGRAMVSKTVRMRKNSRVAKRSSR